MAARGWTYSTVTATGVAAGAGAAQFGLAYGLGVVGWQPVRGSAGDSLWLSSLTWTMWIAATSTVLGAVHAVMRSTTAAGSTPVRGGARRVRAVEVVSRTALVLAAAIGALTTVPLVWLPARVAQRADTFQPEVTAGAYAVVGVIVGVILAVVAVNVRVIAANVVASTAWVWVLAVLSVADAVRAHRTVGTAQLGAWQFNDKGWLRETLHVPGAFVMLGGALLVGVFAALPADRRGDNRVCIAVSGTFGPLLVAAAYFLTAPRLTVRVEQLSSYVFAPYAVVAGLAGSVFVAVLGPLRPRRPSTAAPRVAPPARGVATAADDAQPDLSAWTRALAGDGSPMPAGAMAGVSSTAGGVDAGSRPATGWAAVPESASSTITAPVSDQPPTSVPRPRTWPPEPGGPTRP